MTDWVTSLSIFILILPFLKFTLLLPRKSQWLWKPCLFWERRQQEVLLARLWFLEQHQTCLPWWSNVQPIISLLLCSSFPTSVVARRLIVRWNIKPWLSGAAGRYNYKCFNAFLFSPHSHTEKISFPLFLSFCSSPFSFVCTALLFLHMFLGNNVVRLKVA